MKPSLVVHQSRSPVYSRMDFHSSCLPVQAESSSGDFPRSTPIDPPWTAACSEIASSPIAKESPREDFKLVSWRAAYSEIPPPPVAKLSLPEDSQLVAWSAAWDEFLPPPDAKESTSEDPLSITRTQSSSSPSSRGISPIDLTVSSEGSLSAYESPEEVITLLRIFITHVTLSPKTLEDECDAQKILQELGKPRRDHDCDR